MDSVVNSEQFDVWNGYEGGRWVEYQDRWDAVNGAFNDPLFTLAAIQPHENVLDIGCGTGQTTLLAAGKATGGKVVGIDFSKPMLERARAAAAEQGITNVTFEHGDAQVYPFPEGEFDVVISRFGLTFFADAVAAHANIAAAMRPGGRLAAVIIGNLGSEQVAPVLMAMAEHLPLSFMSAPGPRDALADPEGIASVLTSAGFTHVSSPHIEAPSWWGRDADDAAEFLLNWGPVHEIYKQLDEETAKRARVAVGTALKPHEQPDGVRVRNPAWLISARRP